MSTEERMGIVVGLTVGLATGLLFVALLFRKKVLDCTFDERQERARGVAFKYGFFTLMGSIFLYGASELAVGRWCDALTGGGLCLAAGILVFSVTCILKDAYLSLRERPRRIMTLFVLLSLYNLSLGALLAAHGELVEDGILTFRAINLVVGIMPLVILIVYIVNFLLGNREREAE